MTLQERLRQQYVLHGTNHVQEAADRIDALLMETESLQIRNQELAVDAERLDWVMHSVTGAAWRSVGVEYSAGCTREDIDAAMKESIK